jgi:hypothetical protein
MTKFSVSNTTGVKHHWGSNLAVKHSAQPPKLSFEMLYCKTPGLLLTSRGNHVGNVVKNSDRVILHSTSGRVYEVAPLKHRAQQDAWRSELGRQVKSVSKGHATMACTECHTDWAPPCCGCHIDPTPTATSTLSDKKIVPQE